MTNVACRPLAVRSPLPLDAAHPKEKNEKQKRSRKICFVGRRWPRASPSNRRVACVTCVCCGHGARVMWLYVRASPLSSLSNPPLSALVCFVVRFESACFLVVFCSFSSSSSPILGGDACVLAVSCSCSCSLAQRATNGWGGWWTRSSTLRVCLCLSPRSLCGRCLVM